MVKELGVAYYGNLFPDRVKEDLHEIIDHGCNSILFAISEYNFKEWKKNEYKIFKIANNLGLKLYVNLWAWGGVFGGEAPSFFLHNNVSHRQVSSNSRKKAPAACFNSPLFKDYLLRGIGQIAKKDFIDGFFWDEPHYYFLSPKSEEFYCRCEYCQEFFHKEYQKDMPSFKTKEVVDFKEKSIIDFIKGISKKVKEIDSNKKNIVCLIPPPLDTGIKNWDHLCSSLKDYIDVFSSDPYWLLYKKSLDYVEKYTKKTVDLANEYNLESQLWCLAFLIPKGKESELKSAIDIFDDYNVDSIFSWCYRGGEGMSISSRNPKLVWQIIGEAYSNLKAKYNL